MKTSPLILVVSLVAALSACKPSEKASSAEGTPPAAAPEVDTPEGIANQLATLQNDLAAVMETVTDAASAEAAIPKIGPIAEAFAKLGKKMEDVKEDPGPELKAKLEGIIKPSQERVQAAMTKAMPILAQDKALGEKFQEAMAKMK